MRGQSSCETSLPSSLSIAILTAEYIDIVTATLSTGFSSFNDYTNMESEVQDRLQDVELKFKKACQQIILLDQQIRDLEVRYKRAVKNKKNSFRYNLRLKLSVVTGVKMMYHHYASTKAEDIQRMRRQLGLRDYDDEEEDDTVVV